MRTYDMEERGALSLYEYLYRCIRRDILSGALRPGEKLPSRRRLAEHLRVSVITVEGAYAQLEAEGYLLSRPRQGFFVAAVEAAPPAAETAPVIRRREEEAWRLDLKTGRLDAARFPLAVWTRLTRQCLSEGTFLAPCPHQGLLELRRSIAQDLMAYRGMNVSAEQIVVGAGAEYLYLLLSQLLGRDRAIAVEDPGYPKIRQVYAAGGARVVPVPLDGEGMDMKALEGSGAGAAHLSPAHHYPTGLVTPISRRQALLRWAEENDGYLIEDDYDSEFRFTGRPIPTMQSIDGGGRVIYMNTFSQTISPSMRVGFMVLPPRLLEQYRRELDFYACTVPALEQQVLSRFLSGGHYEQHLSRMRKEYRARREAVLSAFRESGFAPRVRIADQGAGLHFLMYLATEKSDEALRQRAEGLGVRLSFLSEYAAQAPVPQHALVVNYAGLEPEKLPGTMELLGQVFG